MCACSGSVPVAKALGSGSSTIQMRGRGTPADRKSTRLNSSHLVISYAVFFVQKNTRLNSSHIVISYAVFCFIKLSRFLAFALTLHASRSTYHTSRLTHIVSCFTSPAPALQIQ